MVVTSFSGLLKSKYLAVIAQNWQRSLAYRSEMVLWLVLDLTPTIILITVWSSIYRTGQPQTTLDLPHLIQYYLLVALISGLTDAHFEQRRVTEIREGKIDFFFVKPFSFISDIVMSFLGSKAFYIVLSCPVFLLVWWLMSQVVPIAPLELTVTSLILGGILLLIALVIQIMIGLIIVMCGFWFESAEGLEHFKWVIVSLFSGVIAPPELLPSGLRKLVEFLPFKYLYSVPIAVLQGKQTLSGSDFLSLAITLGIGVLLIKSLWLAAVRRYSSSGG